MIKDRKTALAYKHLFLLGEFSLGMCVPRIPEANCWLVLISLQKYTRGSSMNPCVTRNMSADLLCKSTWVKFP